MSHKFELTKFQWKVLEATMAIPLGETRSYQWVARRIGSPKAARAVGQALRRNPYPVVIPCHRVIRADGSLGGYAGGSGGRKAVLLKKEHKIAAEMIKSASFLLNPSAQRSRMKNNHES